MSKKAKRRLLNIVGAAISFILPAFATIAEFPRIKANTGAMGSFAAFLNLSTAALSIIALLAAVTAYRFFRNHLKAPRSGLTLSFVLYVIVRGIRLVVVPLETILMWCVIGCAIAWIFYYIADHKYKDKE